MRLTQANAGDFNGEQYLFDLQNSMFRFGAVRANITIESNGKFITKIKTNWMELADGTRLQS